MTKIIEPNSIDLDFFQHLENIFTKKYKWVDFTNKSKRAFEPYMIHRLISMDPEYVELINELQLLSKGLDKGETHSLLLNIIPQTQRSYVKSIKNQTHIKWNPELIKIISTYFKCSQRESIYHLDTYEKTKTFNVVEDILKMYSKSESEIKKLIKQIKK